MQSLSSDVRSGLGWLWLALLHPSNALNLARRAWGPFVYERQRCGRRNEVAAALRQPLQAGPEGERPDWWVSGEQRWGAVERLRARWANARGRYQGGTTWRECWGPPPRTCSFCGGAHPDDAAAMLRFGWESHGTTKQYKRYLEPAGSNAYHEKLYGPHRVSAEALEGVASPGSPVPPVKVYLQHFTQAQVDNFNAALDAQEAIV